MTTTPRDMQFTLRDLFVVVIVISILLALLVPAIQESRESARQVRCLSNMKQLGLSFQNVESALGRFPVSCRVKKDRATGNVIAVDGQPGVGWSWCVEVLPFVECRPLWAELDLRDGAPLDHYDDTSHPHTVALGTAIRDFHCPGFRGDRYVDPTTKFEAITNYKAMGATHIESLNVASTKPTTPLYGDLEQHPDGGIYPGSEHGIDGFSTDGSSHSIVLVETKEQYRARWTVGREACLVGLPARDVGMTFERQYDYWHPRGYTANAWGDESTISAKINRTYLDWDYEKIPYNDGGIAQSSPHANPNAPFYGPSSDHPDVVNHAYADGSVHSINVKIDAAAYMFLITRNGGDPFPPPERW